MCSLLLETIYLPTLENYSYAKAREFSRDLDQKMGLEIDAIEEKIVKSAPHTPWAGLDPQALQTPYPEIRMILSKLNLQKGQGVIDLGAGYGRMGLVMAHFFSDHPFIGYEISKERVNEGNKVLGQFLSAELIHEDISRTDFKIPEMDHYFIYDFGDLESIVRVIEQLKLISMKKPIRVVGRGRRARDHIERNEPWLSQIFAPMHCGNFSIYKTSDL